MSKLFSIIAVIGMLSLTLGSGAFAAVNSVNDDEMSISAVSSIDSNDIVMKKKQKGKKK